MTDSKRSRHGKNLIWALASEPLEAEQDSNVHERPTSFRGAVEPSAWDDAEDAAFVDDEERAAFWWLRRGR